MYPDPTNAGQLLSEASNLSDATAPQRADVKEIRAWYEPLRLDVCRRMEQRFADFEQERTSLRGKDWQEVRAKYERDMLALHEQRRDAAETVLVQLRDLLTDSQWEALTEQREWLTDGLSTDYVKKLRRRRGRPSR